MDNTEPNRLTDAPEITEDQITQYRSILSNTQDGATEYTEEELALFKATVDTYDAAHPKGGDATDEDKPNDEPKDTFVNGKFKSVSDLEKAYLELQKKLGEPPAEEQPETKEEAAAPEEIKIGELDCQPFFKEFEKEGKLSDASYEALQKAGIPKVLVDGYINGANATKQLSQTIDSATEDKLLEPFGGREAFKKVKEWASTALSKEDQETFNAGIKSGHEGLIHISLDRLFTEYQRKTGSDTKKIVFGDNATSTGGVKPFASEAEMTEALADPRYYTDEAYRQRTLARFNASLATNKDRIK